MIGEELNIKIRYIIKSIEKAGEKLLADKKKAIKVFSKAGIVDKNGKLTEQYK